MTIADTLREVSYAIRDPQRLWDLVRYMRSERHVTQAITDDECAELAQENGERELRRREEQS